MDCFLDSPILFTFSAVIDDPLAFATRRTFRFWTRGAAFGWWAPLLWAITIWHDDVWWSDIFTTFSQADCFLNIFRHPLVQRLSELVLPLLLGGMALHSDPVF